MNESKCFVATCERHPRKKFHGIVLSDRAHNLRDKKHKRHTDDSDDPRDDE